ncbi:DNA methyltransferase [Sphingomonas sp.]|uniref:site-specific DNA-methyltransferase n=1 Tax=Sphingomonas sp. TaxID=28214 RepID=UPI00180869D6|nr:DNA methyltransferase [Sphingomonas sp.]MBA3512329.1 ParB N-terminal domain-containing protein [Sphingomonas sp.]
MPPEIANNPHVEVVGRTSLRPNPRNARTHTKKQITQIAASISRFGFVVPLVIDDDSNIVAGHGRWTAAAELGLRDVPVIRVRFLSEADRRAFAIAENRIAELSGWDQALLGEELRFLLDDGFELEITGFTTNDLDFSIVEEVASAEAETLELPDPMSQAVSRIGDLWHIGPHRLYCGDSRKVESFEALLGDERATLVFGDAPYNVPVAGHVSGNKYAREFAVASGEMTPAEFTHFLRTIFRLCVRFSIDGSIHYQCMDWRHLREILDAGDGIYTQFKQLLVYKKHSAGQGAFYRSQHELILVFKSGRAKHINNFGLGETGRYRTNVLEYDGACGFYKGRDRDLADHVTIKSTALVSDLLRDCSNRGDLVLDPFSGSGTALLACHHTGRRGAAIEIDPLYVDTALRRLTVAMRCCAVHADGRTFEEVTDSRRLEREAANG